MKKEKRLAKSSGPWWTSDWVVRFLGASIGITILRVLFSTVYQSVDSKDPLLFAWVFLGYLACCAIAGLTFESMLSLCGLFRSISDLRCGLQVLILLGEGLLSPLIVVVDALIMAILIVMSAVGALLFLVILVLELGDFNAVTFEIMKQSSKNDSDLITALGQESEKVLGPSYLGMYPRCESPADNKFLVEVYGCSTKNATNKLKVFLVGKGYQVTGVRRYFILSNTFFEDWD